MCVWCLIINYISLKNTAYRNTINIGTCDLEPMFIIYLLPVSDENILKLYGRPLFSTLWLVEKNNEFHALGIVGIVSIFIHHSKKSSHFTSTIRELRYDCVLSIET